MEYRIIAKNAFGSEEIKENQNDGEKCLFLDLNVECFSLTVEYMNLFDISNLCLVCRTFFYEFLPLSIKRIEIFYEDSFRIKHKQFEKQFEEQIRPYWTPVFNCIMSVDDDSNSHTSGSSDNSKGIEHFILQVPGTDYNSISQKFIVYDFLQKDIAILIKYNKLRFCRQFRLIFYTDSNLYGENDLDYELYEFVRTKLKLVIEEAIIDQKFSYLEDFAINYATFHSWESHPLLSTGIDVIINKCPKLSIISGDFLTYRLSFLAIMAFMKERVSSGRDSWVLQKVLDRTDVSMGIDPSRLPSLICSENQEIIYETNAWVAKDSYPLITELDLGEIYSNLDNVAPIEPEIAASPCLIMHHFFTSARFPNVKKIRISNMDESSFYEMIGGLVYEDMLLRESNFFDLLAQTKDLVIDFTECRTNDAARRAEEVWSKDGHNKKFVPKNFWYDEWHAPKSDDAETFLREQIKEVHKSSDVLKEELRRKWNPELPHRYGFLKEQFNLRLLSLHEPIKLFPHVESLTIKNSLIYLERLLRLVNHDEAKGLDLYLQTFHNVQSGFRGFREFFSRDFSPHLHPGITNITICNDTAGGVYHLRSPFGGWYQSDRHQIDVCDSIWKQTGTGESLTDPNNYNDSLKGGIDVGHLSLSLHRSLEGNMLTHIQQLTLPFTDAVCFVSTIMLWLDDCYELSNSVTVYDKALFKVTNPQKLQETPNILRRMMSRYINAEDYIDMPVFQLGTHLRLLNKLVIDFNEYRTVPGDSESFSHTREKVLIKESDFQFFIVATFLSEINLVRSGFPDQSLNVIHFSCRNTVEFDMVHSWLQKPIDITTMTVNSGTEKSSNQDVHTFFSLFNEESHDNFPLFRLERKGMIMEEYFIKDEKTSDGIYHLRFRYKSSK